MNDDDVHLARAQAVAAEYLDSTGNPVAGIVRQGARRLAQLAAITPAPGSCPVCGGEVVQPDTGRRRTFCSTRCRNRDAKRTRKTRVST